jgi:hypothetical protein
LEAAQIWQELAPHYFPTDCFGGSSNLAGTCSTLFSDRLFWRQLTLFGGNWLNIIFLRIIFEIWRELAPQYFLVDCFGGSSDLAGTGFALFLTDYFVDSSNFKGTGSTFFSDRLFWWQLTLFLDRLFWRQLKFGGNWLHFIFRWNVLEIWRELAPHHYPAYCFGGSSDLAGTGSTFFSDRLFYRQLKFGGN